MKNCNTRFELNPKDHPRDKVYVCLITLIGIFSLAFTVIAFSNQFWSLAAFGAAFILLLLYSIRQRNRGEVLELGEKHLTLTKTKPEKTLLKILHTSPIELSVEHVKNSVGDAGIEAIATLNLWDSETGIRRRTILGLFLSRESKIQAAEDLKEFLSQHGLDVILTNKLDSM